MLCSEVQLVKWVEGGEELKPLPCNRWTCEFCQPRRRARLLAIAAAGQPNKILTLTVNPERCDGPTARRDLLHDAWKRLCKRILRQFALPPARRWHLADAPRSFKMARFLHTIDSKTPQGSVRQLHYMAFLERTKLGEPHLHVLLRCPFIPQDWIAEQMAEMTGAPVCWIEQVRNTRQAITYVTKYVTKEPAQFGNRKRYWVSRGWEILDPAKPARTRADMTGISVRREYWSETLKAHPWPIYSALRLADDWVRFERPQRGFRAVTKRGQPGQTYRALEPIPW